MTDRPEILRGYRVTIVPAAEAGPVGPKDRGRRTKFGGIPDELQPPGQSGVTCPGRQKRMSLVGQVDSFEFNGKDNPNCKNYGDERFMFGDVGMIHVWFCFDCLEPLATMDCY